MPHNDKNASEDEGKVCNKILKGIRTLYEGILRRKKHMLVGKEKKKIKGKKGGD